MEETSTCARPTTFPTTIDANSHDFIQPINSTPPDSFHKSGNSLKANITCHLRRSSFASSTKPGFTFFKRIVFLQMIRPEILTGDTASETTNKEALLWLGELAIIHVTGEETGGHYSMVELFATKEGEAPWHIHHQEDEGFFIIEGEMTIYIGGKKVKGKPGDFILAPKGVPHMYTIDTPGHARILMTFSPAGFENFVRATSVPATSLVPPPPETVDIDYDAVVKIASEFGAEFVDPPADAQS